MTTVKKDCFQRWTESADPVEEGPRSQKEFYSVKPEYLKCLPADTKKRDELKNRGVR